ncbi:hypothetical protein CDV50_06830 [Haematobacter massiliensis]|uniref:Uncharacterized protein n=1 Tax=Haematobacter massiliensis TaxID=195105 RepID=A0A086YBN2_9RHOB|nr:5-bromo-4-chloroindolyl phosphate hydrolysis family protein [Haematobacter massiliensis]KFI31682.1 hypothetical protein CN97_04400 [Haematobacter massiliensis]OWJ72071.1 hypothetical protein CDV50_06830 [Haematobacter massiliensis]OWJ81574.1 hypothetical protein CDV51_19180 [Haematobacter massiliensis]QBJ24077.1 hypothetical protein HmaOT1_07280 [Haematobacter massiliensis]
MAERYRGPYSPGGDGSDAPRSDNSASPHTLPPRRRRRRAGGRANFLFLAPVLFLLTAFGKEPVGMALGLAAFGVLELAAWLTHQGLVAEEAYEARNIARRPAIPRKLFGGVMTAAGLFLGGYVPGGSILNPVIYAVLGFALHFFAFGPDPMRDKGMTGIDRFEGDRVARAVDEAESHLRDMKDAIKRAGDRRLEARVDRFADTARAMFRRVEADPRDLTGSRRYLGVYLLGARDATVKFADLYAQNRDPSARAAYEALLDDLEINFSSRTQDLLLNDRTDLDVEIDVLRERLQREGVKTD